MSKRQTMADYRALMADYSQCVDDLVRTQDWILAFYYKGLLTRADVTVSIGFGPKLLRRAVKALLARRSGLDPSLAAFLSGDSEGQETGAMPGEEPQPPTGPPDC